MKNKTDEKLIQEAEEAIAELDMVFHLKRKRKAKEKGR